MSKINYKELIGVRYKKGGRDKNGLDCYGLVKLLHKNLPEYVTPDDDSLISQLINKEKINCEELQTPESECIVLFQIGHFRLHMGIVLPDKERFIHILENRNVAVERLDNRIWDKLRVGYYKWKN